jgi:integrase/recombinase XerD
MSAPPPFRSVLAETIDRFVALKQALGRGYVQERTILAHLDAFLQAQATDLTAESFARWCQTREYLTATVRRRWMRVAQDLCRYRRRLEPDCFVPDTAQFPPHHEAVRPHIFTEAEVASLLVACEPLRPAPGSPLRRETYRLGVALLYTTGLRRGELLRLTLDDYSPGERTLLVRESKFHKSRVLPLSDDGACEIERYLSARRARRLALEAKAPLLWSASRGGRAYCGVGFSAAIRTLLCAADIRTAAGGRPRVHDFRHTFAVHALMRWYRNGADVQAKLPLLATYLGHVSILSTQYYLRYLDPLAGAAVERFADRYGTLITPAPAAEDRS